jgi:hypothetical protein
MVRDYTYPGIKDARQAEPGPSLSCNPRREYQKHQSFTNLKGGLLSSRAINYPSCSFRSTKRTLPVADKLLFFEAVLFSRDYV